MDNQPFDRENFNIHITGGRQQRQNQDTQQNYPVKQCPSPRKERSLSPLHIVLIVFCVVGIFAITGILLWSTHCRHQWSEPTCLSPRICQLCGETLGEPLGHTPGEWEITQESLIDNRVVYSQFCVTCGTLLDEQTQTVDSYVNNGWFYFDEPLFLERYLSILKGTSGQEFTAVRNGSEYEIYLDSLKCATLVFEENSLSHGSAVPPENANRQIDTVRLICTLEDEESHSWMNNTLMIGFYMALDDTHIVNTAENLLASMISNMWVIPGPVYQGESYATYGELSYHLFAMSFPLSYDGSYYGTMTLSASPVL